MVMRNDEEAVSDLVPLNRKLKQGHENAFGKSLVLCPSLDTDVVEHDLYAWAKLSDFPKYLSSTPSFRFNQISKSLRQLMLNGGPASDDLTKALGQFRSDTYYLRAATI